MGTPVEHRGHRRITRRSPKRCASSRWAAQQSYSTSGACDALSDDDPRRGILTAITCPECGGSLWEHDEQGSLRFKCHVGHAYSPESIEVSHGDALEGALWAALRSMQERADLFPRLARRVGGDTRLEQKAELVEEHNVVLRLLVRSVGSEPEVAGDTSGTGR